MNYKMIFDDSLENVMVPKSSRLGSSWKGSSSSTAHVEETLCMGMVQGTQGRYGPLVLEYTINL